MLVSIFWLWPGTCFFSVCSWTGRSFGLDLFHYSSMLVSMSLISYLRFVFLFCQRVNIELMVDIIYTLTLVNNDVHLLLFICISLPMIFYIIDVSCLRFCFIYCCLAKSLIYRLDKKYYCMHVLVLCSSFFVSRKVEVSGYSIIESNSCMNRWPLVLVCLHVSFQSYDFHIGSYFLDF